MQRVNKPNYTFDGSILFGSIRVDESQALKNIVFKD